MSKFLLSLFLGCSISMIQAQISTTGLALWLKADAGVKNTSNLTATDGQAVQTWEDQSGNGNHAIQLTSSGQPVWQQNGGNGGSSVHFSNSSLECANAATLNPAQMSIFIVGKYSNSGSYQSFLMKTPSSSWTSGGYGVSQSGSSSTMTGWVNSYSGSANVGSSSFQKGENILFSMVYQPGSLTVYNNGMNTVNSSNAPAINSTTVPLVIGNSPGNYGLNGDIAEIIIYGTALSNTQREAVEEYLRNKYTIYGTSTPSGAEWEAVVTNTSSSFLALHFPSSNTGFAVGNNQIRKSVDAGVTWTSQTFPVSTMYGAVHFRDEQHGLVSGNSGTILVTSDGGTNWTSATTNTGFSLWGICHLNSTNAVAVGEYGTIIRSTDGGLNWSGITSGTTSSFWAVNFYDDQNGIAVGNGIIYNTSDGGVSWTSRGLSGSPDLRGVWYLEANTAIAVGSNGIAYKTTDNGVSWVAKPTGTPNSLYAIHFLNSSLGVASGNSGTILITTDGGESWILQNSGTTTDLRGVALPSNEVGVASGFNGTVRRTIFQNLGTDLLENNDPEWSLFPNPCREYFTVTAQSADVNKSDLFITDLSGKHVQVDMWAEQSENTMKWTVTTQNLRSGMYLSCLKTHTGIITKRFVVQ